MSIGELKNHIDKLTEAITHNLEVQRRLDKLEDEAALLDPTSEAGQAFKAVIVNTMRGILEGEVARWQKIATALAGLLGLSLLALVIVLMM